MQFALTTSLSFEAFLPTTDYHPIYSGGREVDLNVEVFPSWFFKCRVTWNPLPQWDGLVVSYNVYRSSQQEDGFLKLNAVPLQDTQFSDEETELSSFTDREWYVIEAIVRNGSNVTTWRTRATQVGDKLPRRQTLLHREINRRHWILLKIAAGTDTLILRKKVYGKHCPECYDPCTSTVVKDGCETCFGTGIEGGYYPSIKTLCQFDASQNNKIYTYFGKFEPNEIGMWTIYYPSLTSHDVVIRLKDLSVWRVDSIAPTELLNTVSRQICRLVEIPPSHTLSKLVRREGLI
jgi:hypothetical protein